VSGRLLAPCPRAPHCIHNKSAASHGAAQTRGVWNGQLARRRPPKVPLRHRRQSPIHAFLQLPCKNLRPSNVGPQSAEQSGTPRRAFLTTLARARNRPSGRPLPGHASQTLEGIGQNGQPAMRQLNNSEVTEPELAIEMIGLGAWNKCPPRTHNYTMRLFNPVSSTVLWAWRPRRGISVLPRNRTR